MATADPPRPLQVGGDYVAGDQHVTQNVAGDIVGRDQLNNYINNILQRALSAAEEAEQSRAFEQQRLEPAERFTNPSKRRRLLAIQSGRSRCGGRRA